MLKSIQNILISLLLLAFIPSLSGQQPFLFKQIELHDGLSNNQINHILKDRRGFMWFSTSSGLNRYDGYKFKVFFHNPNDEYSLPDNFVMNVQEDVTGQLWIQTGVGYVVFNPESDRFEKSQTLLSEMGIKSPADLVFIDDDKNFWCYTNSTGFYRFEPETNNLVFLPQSGQSGELSSGIITDIKENQSSYIFIFQSGLIQYMDKSSLDIIHSDNYIQQQKSGQEFRIFVDSDNDIWVYSDGPLGAWLYLSNKKEWKHLRSEDSDFPFRLSSNMIMDFNQDHNGLIWIATDHGGIDIIDKKANSLINLKNQPYDKRTIAHNSISCIYADDTNIIWIGTYKNGISYYSESIYKFGIENLNYFKNDENFKPDVNSVIKDNNGNIWIGTNGSGLVRMKNGASSQPSYKHYSAGNSSLTNDVIVSLCAANDGKLWIGTYLSGMNCFDGNSFVNYRHNPDNPNTLANNNVWSIVEDKSGMIWIGTLGSGLQKFNPKNKQFTTFNSSVNHQLSSEFISSLFLGANDKLIIGTAIGITIFDIVTEHSEILTGNRKGDQSFTNLNVNQVYEDSRGFIWVGTREGLNIWNPIDDTITQLYKSDGLTDNVISGIIEDNQHNMWITTVNGVSKITVNRDPITSDLNLSFVNYNEVDGLQGHEFNLRSIHKSPDGEILMGGTNGINMFNPINIRYNDAQPKVLFTGLKLFNEDVLVGEEYDGNKILTSELSQVKEVTLKYRQNVFSVDFSAMNYILPEKTTFAYMLEGFNTDWLTTEKGTHSVTYTSLAPGKYTLRVKAANSDGYWGEESTALQIRIKPPFWLSVGAYMFYMFLLVSILIMARWRIIRNEQQKFKMKQIELEAQRKHEVDDLKLRFFTNVSHELRTPLTLIISPLENVMKSVEDKQQKERLTLIHKNAIRLLDMVNQLLDFRKSDVNEHSLNLSYGDIVAYLNNICTYFIEYSEKKNIRLTFFSSIDELRMVFDEDKMRKIMMNLLSNAIKFTEKNGSVDVMLKLLPKEKEDGTEHIEIRVIDTGVGIKDDEKKRVFERFYQGKAQNEEFPGSGIGLHIVKEFISICKGTINVYDNVPKGTLFVLQFPVNRLEHITSGSEISEIELSNSTEVPPVREEDIETMPEDGTTILVVDDNDDFRQFMTETLKQDFSIQEASNGVEAWAKIIKNSPDIIISDVMMPEMDGYELCEKVKNDVRTSHIPLILLTAHTAQEHELRGLEIGADDYITKPFNFDILMLRINKILELRNSRQSKFKDQIEIKPSEITITPLDEKLIKNAVKLVEYNIDNSDYSVEKLSKELGISRVHLYKKMTSLTGKSPIEFIRIIRLKRAAQLLRESQLNISEVAYKVGFNNPKSFSKYFKEEFDILPSQYQNRASEPTDDAHENTP